MNDLVRVGTRGSLLALRQTKDVIAQLQKINPKCTFAIVKIKTRGDQNHHLNLFSEQNTGFFVKAIERDLKRGRIDMAVHSLKDVPTQEPKGLALAAFLKRVDPRDILVTKEGYTPRQLKAFSRVGTSSPRRQRQLNQIRQDLKIIPIRGNVNTRIERLMKSALQAIVIARAGLKRLNVTHIPFKRLPLNQFIPCAGQGILAIQIRSKDSKMSGLIQALNHKETHLAAIAERTLVRTLRAGCRIPLGVLARIHGKNMRLSAALYSTKGRGRIHIDLNGSARHPHALGLRAARLMLRKGAKKYLMEIR